jgi:hypothetical protein
MSAKQDHSWYIGLLERHVDGELEAQLQTQLFEHLKECAECSRMWEAEQRLTNRLREVPRLVVVPADFRARIVQRAALEHFERETPVVDDPRYAALFASDEANDLSDLTETAKEAEKSDNDGLPVFVGVRRPRPSQLKLAWRKASPVAAYGFLSVAAMGAFLTANFQGITGLAQAQTIARGFMYQLAGVESFAKEQPDNASLADVRSQSARHVKATPPAQYARPRPTQASLSEVLPHASVARVEQVAGQFRVTQQSIESMISTLARAAEGSYPSPAEHARPQIAALVIRATDRPTAFSFDEDEFGRALAAAASAETGRAADSTSGERLSTQTTPGERPRISTAWNTPDQFTFEGHRYRSYTLPVADGRLNEVVDRLTQYRVAPDQAVIRALSAQPPPSRPVRASEMLFVECQSEQLKNALISLAKKEPGETRRPRPVKIVLVY